MACFTESVWDWRESHAAGGSTAGRAGEGGLKLDRKGPPVQ